MPDRTTIGEESIVSRFRTEWLANDPPRVRDYLESTSDEVCIEQIVTLDLSFRWRQFDPTRACEVEESGFPLFPRVQNYLEFVDSDTIEHSGAMIVRLLAYEYQLRLQQGDQPVRREYLDHTPDSAIALMNELDRIDAVMMNASSQSISLDSTIVNPEVRSNTVSLKQGKLPQVGKYKTLRLLGRGGFGEVWLAEHPRMERLVALKFPRQDRQFAKHQLDGFIQEARKLALLNDIPGIVKVLDIDEYGDVPCIVSDYIDGGSLADLIETAAPSVQDSTSIVARLADSLHLAHLKGITHRDIKPANILIDQQGIPHLADFGLAATENEQLVEKPGVMGTYAYMSPEQAKGASHLVDGRSDIYSLGVVLYRLLTGRLPHVGKSNDDHIRQIVEKEARPLRSINDRIDPELERICLKCLNKQPSDRYTTARDLADDLSAWLTTQSDPSVVNLPMKAIAIGIVLAAAVCIVVAVVLKDTASPENIQTSNARHLEGVDHSTASSDQADNGVKPTVVFRRDSGKNSTVQVNDSGESMQVTSDDLLLVKLARIDKGHNSVSITFKTVPKTGEAGVFIGFRDQTHDGILRFLLIRCSIGKAGTFVVQGVAYAKDTDNPNSQETRGFPVVEVRSNARTATVQLSFSDGKLEGFTLNGHQVEGFYPDLYIDPLLLEATGDLGVYTNSSTGIFSQFEFNDEKMTFQ